MTKRKAAKTATSTPASADAAANAPEKEATSEAVQPEAPETAVVAENDEVKAETGEVSEGMAARIAERFKRKAPEPEGPKGTNFRPQKTLGTDEHVWRESIGRFYIDKVMAGRYWKVFSTAGPVPKALKGVFTRHGTVVTAVKDYLATQE